MNNETHELRLVSGRLLAGSVVEAGYSGADTFTTSKYKNPWLRHQFRFPVSEVFPAYIGGGLWFEKVHLAWIWQEGVRGHRSFHLLSADPLLWESWVATYIFLLTPSLYWGAFTCNKTVHLQALSLRCCKFPLAVQSRFNCRYYT